MSNPIADQLRSIADQIDGGQVEVGFGSLRQPADSGNVMEATEADSSSDDRKFSRDYWVKGQLAAQKGASLKAYNDSLVALAYTRNSDIPLHFSVQCPAPYPVAVAALASIADVGWVNGELYRFDPNEPANVNFVRWRDAGCPHRNSGGTYDHAGRPIDPHAWDELFEKYVERG